MRRLFEIGGYVAAVILLGFGITSLVLAFQSRTDVNSGLVAEKIVGTPDMTPAAISAEAKKAGLNPANLPIPTQSVAGLPITNGNRARIFAEYMRIHTFEATGGLTYSQMARYLTPTGKPTNDAAKAAKTANGQPQANGARDIWVTYTALTTALNMAYFGNQVSLLTMVIGVALIIAGLGFAILAYAAFRWIPAREAPVETAAAT